MPGSWSDGVRAKEYRHHHHHPRSSYSSYSGGNRRSVEVRQVEPAVVPVASPRAPAYVYQSDSREVRRGRGHHHHHHHHHHSRSRSRY
jgi:hypothetical protein